MPDEEMTTLATAMPSFMEEIGVEDCPVCGASEAGLRVRFGGAEQVLSCESCAEAAVRAEEERERQERIRALVANAGGTPRLEEFTFDSYPRDRAHAAAMQAVLGWRDRVLAVPPGKPGAPGLLLYGGIGGGKTGLIWPVVRSFCERERRARYIDFPALLEKMKDAYSKRIPFDQASSLGRVPVLVLDDVGAERPTDWARGELLQLVNTRYERLLPTAYISNYTPDELVDRLGYDDPIIGERIVSRMQEGAVQHLLAARDLRAGN